MKVYWLLWLLMLVYDFSMFLSILLKEHLDPILRFVKLHLYGTTSMQVPAIYICPYILFLVKIFWLYCVFCFVHLLINLCKNVTTTLDVEFGRLQARDMLQHLWTGPISNASVDVVQGGRSVEVRAVGVTKVHAFWLAGSLLITVLMYQHHMLIY